MTDPDRLRRAYETALGDLLAERVPAGHWVGELSDSALSTATASSALAVVLRHCEADDPCHKKLRPLIDRGLLWLQRNQNDDGGWGDTDKNLSNISTTMLVRAAVHLAGVAEPQKGPRFNFWQHPTGRCRQIKQGPFWGRAGRYIDRQGGIAGLRRRYGKDKTFAVPILTNCALAGLVPWRDVSPLPFELACVPHALLGLLRLPVVSYAIPALVAIGQARYFHQKPINPIARLVRRAAVVRSLRVLQDMQPASGGFLEATPLTSFVVMSLADTGRVDHEMVRRGVEFLVGSVRDNGSWPIDTNLATWTTTLSIGALAASGEEVGRLGCLDWLLSCQHQQEHPLSRAAPGGWGWTDLSGAVPDADDTPGALLALAALRKSASAEDIERIDSATAAGVRWLLDLQNADGGWPTFCRGWGALPFDRSAADLTAHAIRALHAWRGQNDEGRIGVAIDRGFAFLARQQRADGSWLPLWFGNQHQPDEENPVYGTSRVLLAYRDLGRLATEPARRGLAWLAEHQNADGGWGSVEETALAVEAVLSCRPEASPQVVIHQGLSWLIRAVEAGRHREPTPIGFYFAKLWYYERLYPLIFTVSALGQAVRLEQDKQ